MIHTSIFDKDLKTFAWAQADWHIFQVLVASKYMETRRTWRFASADLEKSRVAVISVMVMNTYAGEIIDSHECFSPYWPNRSRGVHTTPGKWDRWRWTSAFGTADLLLGLETPTCAIAMPSKKWRGKHLHHVPFEKAETHFYDRLERERNLERNPDTSILKGNSSQKEHRNIKQALRY